MGARAAALLALAASGAYLALALGFPLGTAASPGAGLFPVAVGAYLVLVAAALALAAFRHECAVAVTPGAPLSVGARRRVAVTIAALAGFCLALPWAGYPVVAFAFVTALLRRLGGGGWAGAAAAGLLVAGASYYLFAVLLGVPLPLGLLG